jgi:hypothetical protein
MTVVEVTINEGDISVKGRGVGACSNRERKFAAVLIAAVDGVVRGMETGEHESLIAELIASTIKQRLTEAGLPTTL